MLMNEYKKLKKAFYQENSTTKRYIDTQQKDKSEIQNQSEIK